MKNMKHRFVRQLEVIGIDHGWGNIKTSTQIFSAGKKEITTEPAFFDNVIEYEDKFHKVGSGRVGVTETKVTNENYYLLTLAAIAKELEVRNKRKADILLAAGLPLTRFGSEKNDFHSYLSKNHKLRYRFEKNEYEVTIEKVCIYPQCYAAVANKLTTFSEKMIVVDIGSWTIDIMPIISQIPDESRCVTIPEGLITCMNAINNECVRQFNHKLDELDIQRVMCKGTAELPIGYLDIVNRGIREFIGKINTTLNEAGFTSTTTPIIFVGGGATMMKRYGSDNYGNMRYIEDIRANAKGFEYLANLALQSGAVKIN